MNCLQDYIGLRGCGSSTPGSGLYVNDLPGISLKQIVSLTNEEEATYLDLWAMIQRRAQSRFSLDVREAMGKHYKLKTITDAVNMGKELATGKTAGISDRHGFTIELTPYQNYEYVPSPLNAIHIQELNFYALSPAFQVYFFVTNIDTYEVLFSKQVDIVAGWNNIQINQTFAVPRIACTTTKATFPFFQNTDLPNNHTVSSCCQVQINGFESPAEYTIQKFTSNTYGLSGIFNVVCTWDNLICQNKNIFARPLWYLMGIELLTEQLYSSKLNQFTTVNLQRAKELREEYQVEYAKAVEQIAGGFSLDCDCCLECAGAVQLRETNQFY